PDSLEDIIAGVSLYRPGPMDYIPQFVLRKSGREPIVYDIPCMEKYLKDTYGITVYQEQVMLLSRQLAGFTRGQSDTLRKAMGKKQIEKMNHLEGLFYEGGQKNGYDKKVLNKIWEDWKKFASYAFNKSHATCYSWVAYQTAYLKANYPSEYMAAVLSRNLNDVDKLSKFMDECKAMGIQVKGPDVNESNMSFGTNKKGDIRFGLGGIKGVGSNTVNAIIEEREKNGPFTSIYDLVERINLQACNRKALEAFALAGAFDCFEEISREDFFDVNSKDESFSEVLMRYGQRFQNDKKSQQNSLFGDLGSSFIAKPPIPQSEKWADIEKLKMERELVGMYLSAHPLDPYYIEIEYGCNTKLSQINEKEENETSNVSFGGIVVNYEERVTKRGDKFCKIKLEDYSGSYEIALFQDDYFNYRQFGVVGTPILVQGSFAKDRYRERINFNISKVSLLSTVKGKLVNQLIVHLHDDNLIQGEILKDYINDKESNCELVFQIIDSHSQNHVKLKSSKRILLNKALIDTLNEQEVKFEIIRNK
ncbi:MAG: DNA polymerase III subunit alpha, partial [Muribaculaceae bacterium]|nr:DNA polymerase III subunit alpha [Muribaculaceae bacterium]